MFQSFSPNMLKTYELCPKKFYFKYVKKILMPTNEDIFEFGKNIHALASYYLKKENIYKLENALNDNEKRVWEYLKNIEYFSYETVETEYNLSTKINNCFYGGRLDALVKKDETYYILDYKTGSIPQNPQKDFQTMIYLLAVSSFFKTNNVNFVYIDLKNNKELKIELTENLKKEFIEKLEKITLNINNEDYKKINTNCKCEYNIICF